MSESNPAALIRGLAEPIPSEHRKRTGETETESREIAEACLEDEDYEGAAHHYATAIEQSGEPAADLLLDFAGALEASDQIEDAIEAYEASFSQEPTADAAFGLSACYSRQGRRKKGLEWSAHGLELDPGSASEARHGEALRQAGRPKEAALHLRKAATLEPDDLDLCVEAAEACLSAREPEHALELLDRDDLPAATLPHLLRAMALRMMDEREKALRSAQLAADIDPADARSRMILEQLLREAGRQEEADRELISRGEDHRYDRSQANRLLKMGGGELASAPDPSD